MNERRKKIPVIRYLCYLLAVSILFTGVTFSRYVSYTSGNTDAVLSRFAVSYEIGDMSALTFSNVDYWLNLGGTQVAMNTARSVRFTVRNHTLSENGMPDRISDIDLQSTLRLYAPAEFVKNLAVQVAEVDETGAYVTKTPQYVLKELIYRNGAFAQWQGEELDTAAFENYDARTEDGNLVSEVLTMSGGFSGTEADPEGTIRAYAGQTKSEITLTASVSPANYSVGFYRSDAADESKSAAQLFLDCVKEIPFYTLDISLPDMLLQADGKAQESTFVLFLTVIERSVGEEYSLPWTDDFLTEKTLNGAAVTGYHFEREASVFEEGADGQLVDSGKKTTIRIQKTFTESGETMSYYHIAPLAEGAPSLAHPVTEFFDRNGAAAEAGYASVTDVHGLFGKCSNEGKSGFISFDGITDNPYLSDYGNTENDYAIGQVLSKGYLTRLNVVFVQASER